MSVTYCRINFICCSRLLPISKVVVTNFFEHIIILVISKIEIVLSSELQYAFLIWSVHKGIDQFLTIGQKIKFNFVKLPYLLFTHPHLVFNFLVLVLRTNQIVESVDGSKFRRRHRGFTISRWIPSRDIISRPATSYVFSSWEFPIWFLILDHRSNFIWICRDRCVFFCECVLFQNVQCT